MTLTKHRGELLLFIGALAFSFNGVVSKWVMLAGLGSLEMTQVRGVLSAALLFTYLALRNRRDLVIPRQDLLALLGFGLIGILGVQGFYFYSILHLPVSIALIIEFTAPFWIILWLRFVKRVSVARGTWLAMVLGFSGLILLAQIWSGAHLNWVGVASSLLDALALAYYYANADRITTRIKTEVAVAYGMLISALALGVVRPWWRFPIHIFTQHIHLHGRFATTWLPGWLLLLWVAALGTVLPYFCVTTGIKYLSPATASIIGMLEPLLAGLFAWILLGESFNAIQLTGAAMVLVGIFFADRASNKR
jgi:drug/metabolite transporter (DMT)-like permease